MTHDAMDSLNVNGGEKSSVSQSAAFEQSSLSNQKAEFSTRAINDKMLAVYCEREINNFRCGDPSTDDYCVELLRRVTIKGNQEAWEIVQRCLSETVRGWIELHPMRTVAISLDSKESFAVQAFARFYLAVVTKRVHFSCLSDILQHLQANLNSVIIDTLRAYSRPKEILRSHTGELEVATSTNSKNSEVWENLKQGLSDAKEQRMAFLLFNCGLSPDDIVQSCAEEFNDVQEITSFRYRIIKHMISRGNTFSDAD
jgi:hypothetical protein